MSFTINRFFQGGIYFISSSFKFIIGNIVFIFCELAIAPSRFFLGSNIMSVIFYVMGDV